jgi:hypothetical protein
LEADGESDSDTIKLAAICRRRLRSRDIGWHSGGSIPKWKSQSIDRLLVNA